MKASAKVVAAPSQTPIQVFVRVRPLNKSEKYSIVNVNNGKEVIVKERPIEKTSRNFVFDKAFGPESRQVDVYKRVVYPLIDEVLSGYNCTVFAYGQTGTGKTFTMEGGTSSDSNVSWEEDPMTGIIPRSLSHLFDELRISQLEHTVRVSFLELYNEELFDLLSPLEDSNKLRLFEDSNKKGSVIIQNLEEVPVHNKAQVYKIMEKGSQKRQTAATLMNAHSSRSHTIFSITVHIKETSEKGEELFKIGKLNLVDLAGSENIGRSGAVDKRAREAGNINQSLLTLGRVITSLVEKAPHIPYRESKLTRLLQDSLGGRTKTSIIATVSPALCNLEETLSTLEYAARAKNITNRPEINQKLTKKAFLKEYEEEINRLKRDLLASRDRNGVYVDTENYTKMTLQIEEQEREIGENLSSIKALRAEMEKRQEIIEELSTSNEKAKEEIERQKQSCRETKKVLKEVTVERDENKLLKEKHMETEEKLKKQAEQLLSVANVATVDTMKLHEKIERKSHVETNNASQCEQFCSSLQSSLGEMQATIRNQAQCEAKFFNLLKSGISNRKKTQDDSMDQIRNHLKAVCQDLSERMEKFTGLCQYVRKEKHTKLTDDLIVLKLKLDSNNSTLDTTIFEGIVPQLDDIFNHLNDLDEFLLKFNEAGENVNKDVCHLNSETQRLKKFTKEQMERHLKFLKMIKSTGENLDRFDTLLVETEKSNVEVTDKLVDVIKRAVTDYEASKEEISKKRNEILTQRSDEVEKSRSDLRDLSRNIENDIKECEPNFTGMISLVDRVQLSVNNQQATAVEKLQSWKISESERLESVKVNIENLSSVTKESKKIFDSWSEDFDKGLIESNAKETQLEKTEAQTLLNDVSEQISQSESVLNDLSDSHQTAVTELVNNIDDRLTNSEKSRNEMSKNLCMQDNLIEKFLQEDFKMDTPTGSTPQKREFDYPHNLTATSPHEIILARYRETMKHNLLLDDSLDESIPSEEMKKISSTESLSSTTSTSLNQKENDLDTFIPMSVKKINQSVGSKKRILGETN